MIASAVHYTLISWFMDKLMIDGGKILKKLMVLPNASQSVQRYVFACRGRNSIIDQTLKYFIIEGEFFSVKL